MRNSVNAYVLFRTADAVTNALKANGAVAFNRHLRIDAAYAASGVGEKRSTRRDAAGVADTGSEDRSSRVAMCVQPKYSVFLGNLSFETQEEDIWRHFESCGSIEYVRLVRDPQTQQGKGFGYVRFKERGAVNLALGRHQSKLRTRVGERPIRVFRCFKERRAEKVTGRRACKLLPRGTRPN